MRSVCRSNLSDEANIRTLKRLLVNILSVSLRLQEVVNILIKFVNEISELDYSYLKQFEIPIVGCKSNYQLNILEAVHKVKFIYFLR